MNKISKIITIILFFGFLVTLSVLTVIMPKKTFSQEENRPLSTIPDFSLENVKNKNYMNGLDTFVSDHFVLRTDWITMKTNTELATGKKDTNGVYITDDMFLEKLESPDYVTVGKSIASINKFASKHNLPVFVMVAPTSTGVYTENLPDFAPKFDQKAFIDYIYDELKSPNIVTLDAFSALYSTRDEYVYYRTDHHWTTLGAYYAYAMSINKMGFNPVSLSQFDIEHVSDEFLGTFYSKVLYDGVKADIMDYYHYDDGAKITSVVVDNGVKKTTYDSLYFRDYLNKKDKYSSFTGPNMPSITINTNSQSGKKLLLVKDSYAHCFVPFLAQHYSQIQMVDLRYINNYLDQIEDIEGYDQVMILYNASNFSNDKNIIKLTKK